MNAVWGGQRRQRLLDLLLGGYDTKKPVRQLAKLAGLAPGTFPSGGDLRSICVDLIEVLQDQRILDDFVYCAANDVRLRDMREELLVLLVPDDPEQRPPDRVLTSGELETLTNLITQWDGCLPRESDLAVLVWTALGHIGPVELHACRNVLLMIDLLDRLMHDFGSMPAVLLFLEHLIVHPNIAGLAGLPTLRKLIDDVALRTKVTPENRSRVGTTDMISGPVMVYLELFDDEDGIRPEAVVYRKEPKTWFVYQATAASPDWRKAVDHAITAVLPLLHRFDPEQIRFEIVVPWRLLGEPVDECLLAGVELGSQFEVAIRLGDDLPYRLFPARWERRSRLLHSRGDTPTEKLVRVVAPDALPGRVIKYGSATDEAVAVMILSAEHHPPPAVPDRHALIDGLREGVPVFLWFRGDGNPDRLHELVLSTLRSAELSGIPAAVRAERQHMIADDAGLNPTAQPISVIYDDYGTRPRRGGSLQTARARGGTW